MAPQAPPMRAPMSTASKTKTGCRPTLCPMMRGIKTLTTTNCSTKSSRNTHHTALGLNSTARIKGGAIAR